MDNLRFNTHPLEEYVYSTQLMQAECLAYAYRVWRRQWKGPGRQYCAGALVWQMNDCWPATSWYLHPPFVPLITRFNTIIFCKLN